MPSETIVAVYSTPALAELAIADLKAAGVPNSAIEHFSQSEPMTGQEGYPAGAAASTSNKSHGGFWSWLTGEETTDTTTSQHAMYEQSLASGHTVVTVVVDQMQADQIMDVLDRHKPIDIDQHGGAYAETGAVSTAPSLAPVDNTLPPAAMATTSAPMATAAPVAGSGEQVLSLSEETLQVGKREIDRGVTRVRRYVVERPVEEQIRLRDERVSVFRRPVTSKTTAGIGDSFSDKVIEVTETDEEAVVGKTARVVEEVVVQKAVDERLETIKDTVRHEEVEIETPTTTRPT